MKNNSAKTTPKNQVSIPNFKIEQSEKMEITANAGIFLLAELVKSMNIIEGFARLNLFHRQRIGEAAHILTLVINHFTGGDAICDTRNIKDDPAMRKLFGDMHIPAATTSGDFLERFTEETANKLRDIIHKMHKKYLKKLSKKLGRKITISLDSSLYEVHGNCKENSSQGFKNIFGFHPLFLHIHETGELLDVVFRSGDAFTSTGATTMLEENVNRLKQYFDNITLLADAGFYEKRIVEFCDRDDIKIKFIITAELNSPIREHLTDIELVWQDPVKPASDEASSEVKTRDSHSFNYRMQSLKEKLAKRNRALKTRGPIEVAEFKHTVRAWKTEYRFVYKRQLITIVDHDNQSALFGDVEEYFYHGYVTNIKGSSIEEILDIAHSRGNQENYIKDFKHGLGTVHIPTKHFYGNYAYFLISMLSWNLKCWLLYVVEPDLKIHWKRFRYLFIKVGAQIIKSGRYVIIRFGKGFGRVADFEKWFSRIRNFSFA